MFYLRLATVWIAATVLCLGVGTAAATDYVYDFDNGRVVAGLLTTSDTAGQDNWVRFIDLSAERGAMVTDYSGPPPVYTAGIEGLAVARGGEDSFDSRVNDTNWGYSVPSATAFRVEFNMRTVSHKFANSIFALAVDSGTDGIHDLNELAFQFGFAGGGDAGAGRRWSVREANNGSQTYSAPDAPDSNEVYRVVLDVNPTANLGNGLGSLSVQLLTGVGGMLTPVDGLQDISLGLLNMVDPDPSHWDGMFMRIGYGCILDHLMITVGGSGEPIPGDANLDNIVNDQDASILAAHWQMTEMGWGDGDFNDDQVVNDQDASILAAHWQESQEGAAAPVPEPGMGILLIGGVLALLVFRRRKPAR